MVAKQKKVTWKDVKRRMVKMKIWGWSSMGKFRPSDIMAHLDDIQRILDGRKKAAKKELKKLNKQTKSIIDRRIKSLPKDVDNPPKKK